MADATCAAAVYTHLKEQRRRRSSPPAAVEHPSWAEGSASPGEQRPAKRAKRAKASADDSLRIDPKLLREAGFDAGRKLEHRGDGAAGLERGLTLVDRGSSSHHGWCLKGTMWAQGMIIPAKTLSKEYFTYYIILSILPRGIIASNTWGNPE